MLCVVTNQRFIIENYNIMVISEELIGTKEYMTLQTRCCITQCRYNRVRLYIDKNILYPNLRNYPGICPDKIRCIEKCLIQENDCSRYIPAFYFQKTNTSCNICEKRLNVSLWLSYICTALRTIEHESHQRDFGEICVHKFNYVLQMDTDFG